MATQNLDLLARIMGDSSSYSKAMDGATKTTRQLQREQEKLRARNARTMESISNGAIAAGAAMALGVGKAVKSYADFDKSMSRVQAATQETSRNMDRLRKAAVDAGRSTQYNASESANAITEMAKAGVKTADILGGGLKGALSLAAAGQLEVADAAEIAATAMVQFNLSGKDLPHVADLLAAGAGKAQGEVSDLSMALKQSGLVASQFGLSLDDTVGTLSAFASAGLIGSDAGTSFRTMLLRMGNPTKKSAKLMKDLGLSAYDAQGNFVGMTKFAGQLHDRLSKLTPEQRDSALATIFGSDAIRAANVLYKQGSKGIEDWTKKVNDQGYAAKVSGQLMDNLAGDVEKFQGSLETAFIQAGSGGDKFARDAVQNATKAVDAFGNLSPEAQEAALQITAVTAATLLMGGGLIKGVTAINNARTAIAALTATSRVASVTLKGLKVVGPVALLMGAYSIATDLARVKTDGYAKSIANMGGANQSAASKLQFMKTELKEQQEIVDGFMSKGVHNISWLPDDLPRNIQAAKDRAAALRKEIKALGGDTMSTTDAQNLINRALQGGTVEADKLTQAYRTLSNNALTSEQAHVSFRDSIASVNASLKSNGDSLSINTTAGRANRTALANAAQSAIQYSDSVEQTTGSSEKANNVLRRSRARLVEIAEKFTGSKKKADRYVTSVLGIPKVRRTRITTPGLKQATLDVKKYLELLTGVPDKVPGGKPQKGKPKKGGIGSILDKGPGGATGGLWTGKQFRYQTGGLVKGPGSGTSDDVPAPWLSNGEYVIKEQRVRQLGVAYLDDLNAGRGMAAGGVAGDPKVTGKQDAATKGLTGSTSKLVQVQSQQGTTTDALTAKMAVNAAQLVATTKQIETTDKATNNLTDSVEDVPKNLKVPTSAPGATKARKDVDGVHNSINRLKGKKFNVNVNFGGSAWDYSKGKGISIDSAMKILKAWGHADGGPIHGPGTGTSDSIPALLSNGEHVWTAAEVRRAGGHKAVEQMRNDVLRRAAGGPVIARTDASRQPQALSGAVRAYGAEQVGGLGIGVNASVRQFLQGLSGNAVHGLRFAQAQQGKPYIWGGVGPRGYDCSGYMSAILNVIEGKHPYSRRFTTASFGGRSEVAGFQRGVRSAFEVGVVPGSHIVGTLLGHNVESGGSYGGPKVDGTRGSRNYGTQYGLVRLNKSVSGSGRSPGKSENEGKNFAYGGIEDHVAQISKPTYRVWAEPETGGEAYIPLSPTKRARSTAVLSNVAERFGMQITQAQAQAQSNQEPLVLEFRSGGTRLDDALIEVMRRAVRVRGGNVQVVLGR